VRAGRNPLSVLHIISLCSLPEPDADFYSSVWLCSLWDRFLILLSRKPQILSSSYTPREIFSALLPAISDCPSPDHNLCKERGVSSAVAACAPARTRDQSNTIRVISRYLKN